MQEYMAYLEDDDDDIFTLKNSFAEITSIPLRIFMDGPSFLTHLGASQNDLPCLTIMDLKLPGLGGIETLELIRETNQLRQMKVVIFSTFASEKHLAAARRLDSDIVIKPFLYNEWIKAARKLITYCDK